MNVLRLITILCFFSCLFHSCSTNQHGILNSATEPNYLPTPIIKHQDTAVNHIGVGASKANVTVYTPDPGLGWFSSGIPHNQPKYNGTVRLHRSHIKGNVSYTYAIFAWGGLYEATEPEEFQGTMSFYGTIANMEVKRLVDLSAIDNLFLRAGLRLGLAHERGEHATFRRKADAQDLIENVHPNNTEFTIGLMGEGIIEITDDISASLFYASGFGIADHEKLSIFFDEPFLERMYFQGGTPVYFERVTIMPLIGLSIGVNQTTTLSLKLDYSF